MILYLHLLWKTEERKPRSGCWKSQCFAVETEDGQEYFELKKSEPGAVLTSKNYTGGLDGSEDHSDCKIFSQADSRRMPCWIIVLKVFLSHLNPNVQALFERPKNFGAAKFNPVTDTIWYDVCKFKLDHSTLDNMLRKMTKQQESSLISPTILWERPQLRFYLQETSKPVK